MPSLATIAVDLILNSGKFVSGFSEAGLASRKFRGEFEDAFSNLGNLASKALAPLGEVGQVIGETLSQVGELGVAAASKLGLMGGSLGAVGAVAGIAAGAILAVDAGAIGLAIHTAETAAKLGEMADKAGVSAQFLAGLGVAGRGVGVDTETISGALSKFNASIFKAATAAEGAKTPFTRLGIDIRDSGHHIKDTGELFLEVVDKINKAPVAEEAGLVRAFFGKGGFALLPLILEGIDKVKEKMEEAKSFGLGDPVAIEGARKFKETIAEIQDAVEGVALRLTKNLLPSLQYLADRAKVAFDTGSMQRFADKIADLVKYSLVLGYALTQLGEINLFDKMTSKLDAFYKSADRVHLVLLQLAAGGASDENLKKFEPELFAQIKAAEQNLKDSTARVASESTRALSGISFDEATKKVASFKDQIFNPPARPNIDFFGFDNDKPKKTDIDVGTEKPDNIAKQIRQRIDNLQGEIDTWKKLGQAGTAAEALILEAQQKGEDEFNKLRLQAERDKTAVNAPKLLSLVDSKKDLIETKGEIEVLSKFVKGLTDDFDKQIIKTKEQAAASRALGEAYKQGGQAIADAALSADNSIIQVAAKTEEARQAAELAKAKFGEEAQATLFLVEAYNKLNGQLSELKANKSAANTADLSKDLNRENSELDALEPKLNALGDAYLQSADAVREARIELELAKFVQDQLSKGILPKDLNAEGGPVDQKRAQLEKKDREAYDNSIKQQAAQFDLNTEYQNSITTLLRMRQVLQGNGTAQLLIDAQIEAEQERIVAQWDQAALKVGNFGQRFKAVMNELLLQGRNAGEAVANAFLRAIDGIESQFAKLLTGQKANFKQVFQNLAEEVAKSAIQKGVGSLLQHFGFGSIGKADGSSEGSALWVRLTSGAVNQQAEKHGGVLGGIFGKVLGGKVNDIAADGSRTHPFYVVALADLAAGPGSGSGFGFGLGGGSGLGGGGGGFSLPSDANIPIFGKPHGGSSGSSTASTLFGSVFGGLGKSILGGIGNLDEQGTSSFWEQFLNFFSGAFGGAKAGGGDMRPGRWYLTGEKGPEIISPSSDATVTPLSKLTGGKQANISMPLHFHGFKDNDMFRKSENQIAQHVHRQAQIAYSRAF